MVLIYIGIDDTDNKESRGTGHLARTIAQELAQVCEVKGITRHQLFFDPRVPYTSHNSSAAIHLFAADSSLISDIFSITEKIMLDDFQPGSDPGLCVAAASAIPDQVVAFGNKAKVDLVRLAEARQIAAEHHILLRGLGGTEDGVIGALSAVGLAFSGNDGRYIQVGSIRSLEGKLPIEVILTAGIDSVRTQDGTIIQEGMVLADKIRPALRNHQSILYVQPESDYWLPIKLD